MNFTHLNDTPRLMHPRLGCQLRPPALSCWAAYSVVLPWLRSPQRKLQ